MRSDPLIIIEVIIKPPCQHSAEGGFSLGHTVFNKASGGRVRRKTLSQQRIRRRNIEMPLWMMVTMLISALSATVFAGENEFREVFEGRENVKHKNFSFYAAAVYPPHMGGLCCQNR